MGIEELNIAPMEKVTDNTARPSTECIYPRCEECSKYMMAYYEDCNRYCTVPMVITKQIFLITEEKMRKMEQRIDDLESLVKDEILRVMNHPRIIHFDNVNIEEKLP